MSAIDNKLYTVAGTSVRLGVKKYRFATSSADARSKVLTYNDHTDVELFNLDTPMTKAEAITWLGDVKNITAPILMAKTAAPVAKVAVPLKPSKKAKAVASEPVAVDA